MFPSKTWHSPAWLAEHWRPLLLTAVFALSVALGLTGSSLGWYKDYPGASAVAAFPGERKLIGQYRGIRGDEFIAHGTPNAVAQYLAEDRFPRKNTSLGLEGRDFLALHDLGAPIRHVSMVFRPANWGFFLFDLRRALSFYWICPIFFGLLALELLLDELFPGQKNVNFLLSAAAVFSPYAAGWSFWPVNNVYGLCFSAFAVLKLAGTCAGEEGAETEKRGQRLIRELFWALLAVWGAGCAALSLYMPRILPAAYLVSAVTAAELCRRKAWKKLFSAEKIAVMGIAAVLGAAILLTWRADAGETIGRIRDSVYPGRRRMNGGSMELWELMKGYLGFLSVYRTNYTNQSEMQSVLSLFFPWLILTAASFRSFRRDVRYQVLLIFVLIATVYQFVGFPELLAAVSGWALCNPPRCAMALVLAQSMLLALLYARWKRGEYPRFFGRFAAAATALCGAAAGFVLFCGGGGKAFAGLAECFSPAVFVLLLTAAAVSFLAVSFAFFRNIGTCVFLYAGVNILLGAVFNPVCVAPKRVENLLVGDFAQQLKSPRYGGRTLFACGNDFLAVLNFLSGGRSLNGYFMYADEEIWRSFFARSEDAGNYRRMTHLDAEISPPGSGFAAVVTHSDRIKLFFPADYDFAQVPADVLATPEGEGEAAWGSELDKNPSLRRLFTRDGVVFRQISHPRSSRTR